MVNVGERVAVERYEIGELPRRAAPNELVARRSSAGPSVALQSASAAVSPPSIRSASSL